MSEGGKNLLLQVVFEYAAFRFFNVHLGDASQGRNNSRQERRRACVSAACEEWTAQCARGHAAHLVCVPVFLLLFDLFFHVLDERVLRIRDDGLQRVNTS